MSKYRVVYINMFRPQYQAEKRSFLCHWNVVGPLRDTKQEAINDIEIHRKSGVRGMIERLKNPRLVLVWIFIVPWMVPLAMLYGFLHALVDWIQRGSNRLNIRMYKGRERILLVGEKLGRWIKKGYKVYEE